MNPSTERRARQGFLMDNPLNPAAADPRFDGKVEVPAIYVVSILLSGEEGKTQGGKVQLRPEDFLLRRITWACTGDTPLYSYAALPCASAQGRSVEILWSDEFTQFLGDQPSLISALFGDSQGFLDIERPGIFFEGSQTLSVKLNRLFWPDPQVKPEITRFDFVFHGVGLLPPGKHSSGSL